MRPERFARTKVVSGTKFASLAILLLAPPFVVLSIVSSAAPRANAAPLAAASIYDAGSFTQELHSLDANLYAAGGSTDALRAYREALPKSWPVDADGRHYEVPAGPLLSHLMRAERRPEERERELEQAHVYLDSLAAEASSFSGEPAPPTSSARSKLDAILARPEYARAKHQSWYGKVRERIDEFFLNLLERVLGKVGGEKTFGYVLLWISIAAATVLIAYSVFRNWFRSARAAEIALAGSAHTARSWQEWVFAAREAAARANYRMAVHCAYWAGIARLQDVGALSPDRAKTPREYLRALTSGKPILAQDAAARRQALAQMTSRLEKTWYGYQPATESDFRDAITQLELLGCRLP